MRIVETADKGKKSTPIADVQVGDLFQLVQCSEDPVIFVRTYYGAVCLKDGRQYDLQSFGVDRRCIPRSGYLQLED